MSRVWLDAEDDYVKTCRDCAGVTFVLTLTSGGDVWAKCIADDCQFEGLIGELVNDPKADRTEVSA